MYMDECDCVWLSVCVSVDIFGFPEAASHIRSVHIGK